MENGKPVAILLVLVCAVIGDKTGKCIDAEVMSSFCKGCDSWKRRKGSLAYKKWKILHVEECLKNHNGSAGMMETMGMVRIFQRSLSHRSVRYTSYIGMAIPKHSHLLLHPIRMEKISQFQKFNVLDMFKKEWELVYEN
ncbi:uncharacterized protein TNCV_3572441 [Trichonephila clavipes]|nr:uncharacterized protein TNCV_3572441 [Trichonephila clavipes]